MGIVYKARQLRLDRLVALRNPSDPYLAEHGAIEQLPSLYVDAYIVRKEPSEILLAGYRMWRASMVLLAGGGLYGSWRSRRRGRAEDIKTILPEIDPPQTGSARYFDSP